MYSTVEGKNLSQTFCYTEIKNRHFVKDITMKKVNPDIAPATGNPRHSPDAARDYT